MEALIGTYDCKTDGKGRIALPIALVKQLGEAAKGSFIVKRSVFNPCLELYPMSEWQIVMQKMNKLNRFVKKNSDFIRMFSAGAKQSSLDSANRILIAKDLIDFAKLDKEVVLSSTINIIEIWDKNRYEASLHEIDDFARLAEEVMGNSVEDDRIS